MKHDINGSTLSLPSVSLRGCQLTFQLINQQEFNPFYKRSLTFVDEFNSFFFGFVHFLLSWLWNDVHIFFSRPTFILLNIQTLIAIWRERKRKRVNRIVKKSESDYVACGSPIYFGINKTFCLLTSLLKSEYHTERSDYHQMHRMKIKQGNILKPFCMFDFFDIATNCRTRCKCIFTYLNFCLHRVNWFLAHQQNPLTYGICQMPLNAFAYDIYVKCL